MGQCSYSRHRFPPAIIQHAIWLYLRFTLSYRDVEELLAERGLEASYETVRRWVLNSGPRLPEGCGGPVHGRATGGTSTKWSCGSPVSGCTCGAQSITKGRCWIFWFSAGGASARPFGCRVSCSENTAWHRNFWSLTGWVPTDLPCGTST